MKLQNKIEGMKARLDVDGELLTDQRKQILSYAIKELLSKLKNGDLDPISVLEAYQVIWKIQVLNEITNDTWLSPDIDDFNLRIYISLSLLG